MKCRTVSHSDYQCQRIPAGMVALSSSSLSFSQKFVFTARGEARHWYTQLLFLLLWSPPSQGGTLWTISVYSCVGAQLKLHMLPLTKACLSDTLRYFDPVMAEWVGAMSGNHLVFCISFSRVHFYYFLLVITCHILPVAYTMLESHTAV